MRLARELIPYMGASGAAFALDVSLLWLQVSVIGVPYLAAAAISFLTGTAFVYWASVRHIFGFRRLASARNEFAFFLSIGLVGLAINLGVIYLGVSRLGLHYLLAKIGAAGFTFLANFAMRRARLARETSSCFHRNGSGRGPARFEQRQPRYQGPECHERGGRPAAVDVFVCGAPSCRIASRTGGFCNR